jgi:hypothetical protein
MELGFTEEICFRQQLFLLKWENEICSHLKFIVGIQAFNGNWSIDGSSKLIEVSGSWRKWVRPVRAFFDEIWDGHWSKTFPNSLKRLFRRFEPE